MKQQHDIQAQDLLWRDAGEAIAHTEVLAELLALLDRLRQFFEQRFRQTETDYSPDGRDDSHHDQGQDKHLRSL